MLKKTNWKHFYLLLNGRKNKRKLPDLTALCQLTLCIIDISGEKNEEELFKMGGTLAEHCGYRLEPVESFDEVFEKVSKKMNKKL